MVFSLCDVGPFRPDAPWDGAGPEFSTSSPEIRHESSEDEPERIDRTHRHDRFFHLARTGRSNLDGLITHVGAPAEGEAAYRVPDERPAETVGVCFDWTSR